ESLRQSLREERAKALASPILVEIENPTIGDQMPLPSPQGAAGLASALGTTDAAGTGNPSPAAPPPMNVASAIADSNMQQHKSDFLARDGEDDKTYVSQPLMTPRSPFEVKAGTIIPTTLITGINSD